MNQLNLFDVLNNPETRIVRFADGSIANIIPPRGDAASSQQSYMWLVECDVYGSGWKPDLAAMFKTREAARRRARGMRANGYDVRVVPYKACVDSRGRTNRQVRKERIK